jgi:hypothetical protein
MVTKQRLRNLITRYKKKLGLEDHHIDVLISDKIDGDKDYFAEVTNKLYADQSYTISFLKDEDRNLSDTVKHELLHILLWGLLDVVEGIINVAGLTPDKRQELLRELELREHAIIDKLTEVIK